MYILFYDDGLWSCQFEDTWKTAGTTGGNSHSWQALVPFLILLKLVELESEGSIPYIIVVHLDAQSNRSSLGEATDGKLKWRKFW